MTVSVFVARLCALIETKMAPENGWKMKFPFWDTILSGATLAFFGGYVSFKQFPRHPTSSKYLVRIGALEPLKAFSGGQTPPEKMFGSLGVVTIPIGSVYGLYLPTFTIRSN